MIDQKSLAVRAMQIATTADGNTYTAEALAQALIERFDNDPKLIAEALAGMMKSAAKSIKGGTSQLPAQATLFDVPELIAISTPIGDLLIHGEDATTGQSRQWGAECEQWHKQQAKRFTKWNGRLDAEIESGALDPKLNHRQQLRALTAKRSSK
jgi:hypothetical protein